MKCPACGHENVSDFPFCEECLTLLPARPGNELAFELDVDADSTQEATKGWPPFPWNPSDLPNRLIGRDKALDTLLSQWAQTVETWSGRLHLLVSEFGMGKGQVTRRLAKAAIQREPQGKVVRVRCPERGGPYRMWDAVIRGLFEIGETDGPTEAGAQLRRGVGRYLTDEVDEVAGVIADLIGYRIPGRESKLETGDAEAVASRGSGALSRLLGAIAQEPLMIIVTQADRGSTSSLALAGALEAALKDHPVMMVLAGPPGLSSTLPGWERFPATRLDPLPKKDAEDLINLFLTGLNDVPVELVQRIVERARGNPWAIKSLLHYLGEAGAIAVEQGRHVVDESTCWDLEWPDALEGVILARLGTLSPRDRVVLGSAAIVGRAFWTGALVAMERQGVTALDEPGETVRDNISWEIARSLERLYALRFIEKRSSAIQGEEAWAFRSELHHKVASTIVADAARSRYHVVIEQWLRLHAGDNIGPHLRELARHAELAGRRSLAADYYVQSAQAALRSHQPQDAATFLLQAQALVDRQNRPAQMTIALDLWDARVALGDVDGALASYQEALHLSWQLRHLSSGARVLLNIGKAQNVAGRYKPAARNLEAALRLFEQVDNREGVGQTCLHLGKLFWLKGAHGEALKSYRRAERLFAELENDRGLGDVADAIATLHLDRGNLAQAERFYRRSIQLRNSIDDPRGVAAGLCNLGVAWLGQKKKERAVTAWREGLELATIMGQMELKAALASNMGEVLLDLERFHEAEDVLAKAIEWADDAGSPRTLANARINQAGLLIHKRDWRAAVDMLEMAGQLSQTLNLPRVDGQLARMTGLLFLGKHEEAGGGKKHLKNAIKQLQEAITCFIEAGCYLEAAGTHSRLADTFDLTGQTKEAERERETAEKLRSAHAPTAEDSSLGSSQEPS